MALAAAELTHAARKTSRPIRLVFLVVVIYATARVVSLAAVFVAAGVRGRDFAEVLTGWDGAWYTWIAVHGYGAPLTGAASGQQLIAFLPGYPAMIRVVAGLPGVGFADAALAVSLASGAVAAVLIMLVVRRVSDDRTGLIAAALWSAQPAGYALSAAYSEALFTALAAGCLLALLYRRWVLAGILATLAGLTRSVGVTLVLACVVAAIVAVRQRRDWAALVAPLLAPAGIGGYLVYVHQRTGRWDTWFTAQREGWHVRTDGGLYNLHWTLHLPQTAEWMMRGIRLPLWHVPILLGVFIVLAVLAIRDRLPAPLLVYGLGILVITLTTAGVYSSLPRFLVPAFPLLIPAARRLAPRPMAAAAVCVASAVVMCGLMVLHFVLLSVGDPAP